VTEFSATRLTPEFSQVQIHPSILRTDKISPIFGQCYRSAQFSAGVSSTIGIKYWFPFFRPPIALVLSLKNVQKTFSDFSDKVLYKTGCHHLPSFTDFCSNIYTNKYQHHIPVNTSIMVADDRYSFVLKFPLKPLPDHF